MAFGRATLATVKDMRSRFSTTRSARGMAERLATLQDFRQRFGTLAALEYALHHILNVVIFFEWMDIIVLERAHLRALDPALSARLSARLATLTDLEAMAQDPRFDIGPVKLDNFRAGDSCLLSYADGKLAGYTWAHTQGRPELIPGLVISVPAQYLYNYAALTLPEFRGLGLQPYRHHELLESGLWQDKRGLLGFVLRTNYASRRGQTKSGYRMIGSIWLIGTREHFVALPSSRVRRAGIRRL